MADVALDCRSLVERCRDPDMFLYMTHVELWEEVSLMSRLARKTLPRDEATQVQQQLRGTYEKLQSACKLRVLQAVAVDFPGITTGNHALLFMNQILHSSSVVTPDSDFSFQSSFVEMHRTAATWDFVLVAHQDAIQNLLVSSYQWVPNLGNFELLEVLVDDMIHSIVSEVTLSCITASHS